MEQSNTQLHHANLFTSDMYQFTCSYSYFQSNKHEQNATFQVFFRKYPFGGNYVVLGGIRSVKQFLDHLQITPAQEKYLLNEHPHLDPEYFSWLRQKLSDKNLIKIKSFKEGEIVFAKEPLITYSGPLGIVQLLETPILNLIGFSSLVATNASRMAAVVAPKKCVEFGIRRAQGPDGGLTASEFAYLGGFIGTSNIHASKNLNIPVYGTMSHAYVTSFSQYDDAIEFELNGKSIKSRVQQLKKQFQIKSHEGQLASFIMFAKSFPNNFVTLIDTYSTLSSGILNTILVSKALNEAGFKNFGIRLDSGNLAQQSIECRNIWNKYFPDGPRLNILASDDLHEERLIEMVQSGNQIDVFAIGTHIATCKKQPALGLVCKLVELNGQGKMKLSEDGEKATYPFNKSIYRIWTNKDQNPSFDIITLNSEQIGSSIKIIESQTNKAKEIEIVKKIHLNQDWESSAPYGSLLQCKNHFEESKKNFPQVMQIKNSRTYSVLMSEQYYHQFKQTQTRNKIAKQN